VTVNWKQGDDVIIAGSICTGRHRSLTSGSCRSRADRRTFFTREPEADLDLERFVRILDQFPGVERVVLLHGVGEPLLARDLPDMVGEANRRGARILFNTNALALHRRLAERLVAAGLDELRVSMDAADGAPTG
jgi:MoaA/NifB/PqqE/SkfB family radical SAM enzyme